MTENELFTEEQPNGNTVFLSITKEAAEAIGTDAVLELWRQIREVEADINADNQ